MLHFYFQEKILDEKKCTYTTFQFSAFHSCLEFVEVKSAKEIEY